MKNVTVNAYLGLNLLDGESLNYYYSLANKFFDYLHVAIPAVNTNFPEYRRINDEKLVSILIDVLSENSIINGINSILFDKELHEEIVENCLIMREKYNWGAESIKLINIYRRFD